MNKKSGRSANNVQNQRFPQPRKEKYVDSKGNKYFQEHIQHAYSTTMLWRGLTKQGNDDVEQILKEAVEARGGKLVGQFKQIPGK